MCWCLQYGTFLSNIWHGFLYLFRFAFVCLVHVYHTVCTLWLVPCSGCVICCVVYATVCSYILWYTYTYQTPMSLDIIFLAFRVNRKRTNTQTHANIKRYLLLHFATTTSVRTHYSIFSPAQNIFPMKNFSTRKRCKKIKLNNPVVCQLLCIVVRKKWQKHIETQDIAHSIICMPKLFNVSTGSNSRCSASFQCFFLSIPLSLF